VLKASIFVFLIVVAANHVERDATDAAASDRNDLDDRFVDAKDEIDGHRSTVDNLCQRNAASKSVQFCGGAKEPSGQERRGHFRSSRSRGEEAVEKGTAAATSSRASADCGRRCHSVWCYSTTYAIVCGTNWNDCSDHDVRGAGDFARR
jgi:hypothetical protein